MTKSNSWRAGIVAAALVAWPLVATAQTDQSGSQQGTSTPTQQPGSSTTTTQQDPQTQSGTQTTTGQPPATTQGQGYGQGQGQGDTVRQQALSQLTAARQSLADMTKLPAASHLEGQARSEINQLISNFNTLITSSGPEWRDAYDRVQGNLRSLLGPSPAAAAAGAENAAVGTSGTTGGAVSLDPAIAAKLNEVRQHVDEFGQTVGVPPGQSAAAQAASSSTPQSGASASTSGTTGTTTAAPTSVANEQAMRNIDQINAILSRIMAQPSMSPNQDSVTVSKQDLQQIQQYLNQLRQSVGGAGR